MNAEDYWRLIAGIAFYISIILKFAGFTFHIQNMKLVMIIAGIVFFIIAILDISGCTFHLSKRYRKNELFLSSRKKTGFLSIITGASIILYALQADKESAQALVWSAVLLAAVIILLLYEWHVMKIVRKEEDG